MRTPEEIASKVASRIGQIFVRPSMYADGPNLEHTLYHFHWMWVVIHDREPDLDSEKYSLHDRLNAPNGLWERFTTDNPDSDSSEAIQFVVAHWRTISEALGVPLNPNDS